MTTEKEKSISMTTVKGEEEIPRNIVCRTETFSRLNKIISSEDVVVAPDVS